jgi:hypothetical protein
MKKIVAATLGLTLSLAVEVAGGRSAAASPIDGTTTTTFAVGSGSLGLDMPPTVYLGKGAQGTVLSGQMGAVAVTDTRGAGDASWTASVVSSDFTTGVGTPNETVPATRLDYWSGPATGTAGNGTFTPGQPARADLAPLDTTASLTAFSHIGGTGGNTATWNPTLEVRVPAGNANGNYSGLVAHSVA